MFSRTTRIGLFTIVLLLVLSLGTAAQVRNGAKVDEVVLIEVAQAEQAISRLIAGDIDIYAYGVTNAALFEQVRNHPALDYYQVFGSYTELTFNTYGPEFTDGSLNPFHSRRVREAMNWLVDREYLAQEIYAGLAVPKYTVLTRAFADYARVVEKMRELETIYSYDLGKAEEVVREEMLAMGAELRNGKWYYKGQPVVVKILARTEDERREVGNYFAAQLEKIGFTTEIDYKAGADASPIWLQGDPSGGAWMVYTGGWSSPVVYRSQAHNFEQMYTRRIMANPPWQILDVDPELDEISSRLYNYDFKTMEERNALMERILELGFKDSPRIFLVDRISFVPRRAEISVASDLGGGVAGTLLWAPTLAREGQEGGRVIIALPSLLDSPWNPIAGSNNLYDQMAIRATMERSIIVDPYTGNQWANRIERAEVTVLEGYPVSKSLDWVDLKFTDSIVVPEDAWVDWDATEQRFITAGEKFPEGLEAVHRSVVYFPEDFFETVKWHDGSPISLGDILFAFIIGFDRGKPESAIHDKDAQDSLEINLPYFKGMRILSTDPLIIESYSDNWSLDAEFMYGEYFPVDINHGPIPWHTVALGVLAEANRELAFSNNKAAELGVEWLGMHTGPSIAILAKYLQQAKAENYIPYYNTLKDYITPEEAALRWSNLEKWYNEHNHFWLGTGVMYLDRVYPVERQIVLKRFEDHPDPSDKWDMFDEPRIPEVTVVSDGRLGLRQGREASFQVAVTFDGEPYPMDQIVEVGYLIQRSSGEVVSRGTAAPVGDSIYEIELLPSLTRELPFGANRLTVFVTTNLVGGAQFAEATFVVTP